MLAGWPETPCCHFFGSDDGWLSPVGCPVQLFQGGYEQFFGMEEWKLQLDNGFAGGKELLQDNRLMGSQLQAAQRTDQSVGKVPELGRLVIYGKVLRQVVRWNLRGPDHSSMVKISVEERHHNVNSDQLTIQVNNQHHAKTAASQSDWILADFFLE